MARKVFSILSWIFTSIFCAALLFFTFSGLFTTVLVSGNSMVPTYQNGDLVIAVKQDSYEKGDIVVYPPEGIDCEKCNVIHRIVDGDADGWVTRGDNNSFDDAFRPTSEDLKGKTEFHVPLGVAGTILTLPQLWLFLFTLIFSIFYGVTLRRWLKSSPNDEEDDDPSTEKPQEQKSESKSSEVKRNASVAGKGKLSLAATSLVASITAFTLVASAAPVLLLSTVQLGNGFQNACTTAQVSVTTNGNSNSQLIVNNIAPECLNERIVVRTKASNAANSIQGAGLISSNSISPSGALIPNASAVNGAAVVINGFTIPAVWVPYAPTPVDPIVPPNGAGFSVAVTYTQPNAQQICAAVTVSTTSTTPIPWNALLNTNGIPFDGDTNASHYQFNPNSFYRFASNTPVNGVFTIEGIGARSTVVAGNANSFTVCNYSVPMPSGREPGVTYTVTPGDGINYTVAPSWYPCQTFTVSTSGATRFYVGWDATISAAPLAAAFNAQSGQTGSVKLPTGAGFTAQALGGNQYKIAGNGWNTAGIKDGTPVQFTVCWGG